MPAKKQTKQVKKTTVKKTEAPVEKKEVKQTAKSGTKKVQKADSKTTAKKTEVKKTAEKSAESKTESAVKTAPAKAAAKKPAAKKTTAKTTKSTAKKTTAAKAETKTAAKTTAAKKPAAKKPAAKKTAAKPAAKKTAAETAPKKDAAREEKLAQYNSFTLETCIDMAKAMGVDMEYDQYVNELMDNADLSALAKDIVAKYGLDKKNFTFEDDGYDAELIEVLLNRIAGTMDIKASDFVKIADEVKEHVNYEIKDDSTANNDEYNAQFDLVKRILMIAQRKNISSSEDMVAVIKVDPADMIEKFMDLAYNVLKLWKYDDVKYYENFIYAVLSQFENLHKKLGNKAMMDVADLYIQHGDYGLGDANYNYILRENQIKDYIYFRYANVYFNDIDRDKAKSIANSALEYVDDRYKYYPDIKNILES
ncbi:neurofilament protein [Catenisphaera adipataccumulans]|uniref:Neurofilament protein n=1 Tax=Catenisphaera adipataccumulans TaxID=700500 RepID=A0A7W8FUU2_9FIRM|nr:neurofilament protein [Catenisphaera adipataccumulans]MBB5182919.1 hypothetical protein [Catenisphaera adipataccumulans]